MYGKKSKVSRGARAFGRILSLSIMDRYRCSRRPSTTLKLQTHRQSTQKVKQSLLRAGFDAPYSKLWSDSNASNLVKSDLVDHWDDISEGYV